jgi:hypothetical protein
LQADIGLPFGSIQSEAGDAIQHVAHMERRGSRRELTELIRIMGFCSDSGAWQVVPAQQLNGNLGKPERGTSLSRHVL